MDVVGQVVHASGGWAVGDHVAALVRTGGNSRFVNVPASALVKVPPDLDAAEAVALVTNYTTAYQALKRTRQEGSVFSMMGKKVLIVGGMDGPGQALIQMCLKARATVYATGPVHRHSYIQTILGAKPLPEEGWLTEDIQGKIDVVFDGLCDDGLQTSHKALNETGELVCFGHRSMLREKEIGILGAPMSARLSKIRSQMLPRTVVLDIWESFLSDPITYKVRQVTC